jgi:hypothetical protein
MPGCSSFLSFPFSRQVLHYLSFFDRFSFFSPLFLHGQRLSQDPLIQPGSSYSLSLLQHRFLVLSLSLVPFLLSSKVFFTPYPSFFSSSRTVPFLSLARFFITFLSFIGFLSSPPLFLPGLSFPFSVSSVIYFRTFSAEYVLSDSPTSFPALFFNFLLLDYLVYSVLPVSFHFPFPFTISA